MTIVTQTPPTGINIARTDFVKTKFDALVWEKGYDCILESSLKCPCISRNSNQQSSCKNCGGTGWIFCNAVETRIILSAQNATTKFKEWSQENIGTVSVTALSENRLGYMDRITVKDAESIFSESLFIKQFDDVSSRVYYFETIYDIKEITYLALFRSTTQTLLPLVYGTDFSYSNNRIIFLSASTYIDPLVDDLQDISITIRYIHAPQYHAIDIQRETMQSITNITSEGEKVINLPIHCIARRSHYVLDRQNYTGDRVLNNDHIFEHDDLNPTVEEC